MLEEAAKEDDLSSQDVYTARERIALFLIRSQKAVPRVTG
jgi:hypothetical protein